MASDPLPLASVSATTVVDARVQPSVTAGLGKAAPYFMLDAWRGIAALWVVMLHSCLPYILNGHRHLLHQPVYMVSIWGRLGVTIFFVISGYCITGAAYNSILTQKPLARFCADRVRRIYPPYIIALLLVLLLASATNFLLRRHVVTGFHPTSEPSATTLAFWLSNLTLTQVIVGQPSLLLVAWSLCFEIVFYGLIACLLQAGLLMKRRTPEYRVAVLAGGVGLLTCGSLAWLCVSPSTCPFPLPLWYQFGFGSLLFLWFAVRDSRTKEESTWLQMMIRSALAIACLLTALFAALHEGLAGGTVPLLGIPSTRAQAITTVVFGALLYVLRPYDSWLLRSKAAAILMRVGAFSYSLYLVHLPLFPYVDAGLRRLGFTESWYLVPYGLQIVVAIAAGWLFFLLVEHRFISGRQVHRLAAE